MVFDTGSFAPSSIVLLSHHWFPRDFLITFQWRGQMILESFVLITHVISDSRYNCLFELLAVEIRFFFLTETIQTGSRSSPYNIPFFHFLEIRRWILIWSLLQRRTSRRLFRLLWQKRLIVKTLVTDDKIDIYSSANPTWGNWQNVCNLLSKSRLSSAQPREEAGPNHPSWRPLQACRDGGRPLVGSASIFDA